MLTACFARALQRWTRRICVRFLLYFNKRYPGWNTLAELSFSLQRASSGSAVRISAPALTLKRPSACRSV